MDYLDPINREIIRILQTDSSITVKEIASRTGLSATPVHERIRNLEQAGVLQKYVTICNPVMLGFNLMVYCNVILKDQGKSEQLAFEKAASKIANVLEVISISGTYDYMLKIVVSDIAAYNNLLMNEISALPNIQQYHSNFVLNTVKQETAYPI